MVITEITKIGKAKNNLIIPNYEIHKMGWKDKDEVIISESEDKTYLIIEKA